MSEAEKIVFHDRDAAAIGRVLVNAPRIGALMRAAILLTLSAIANARGAFAMPAFGFGAIIMLAATLRPSRLVPGRASRGSAGVSPALATLEQGRRVARGDRDGRGPSSPLTARATPRVRASARSRNPPRFHGRPPGFPAGRPIVPQTDGSRRNGSLRDRVAS
jgi:hypothetical protein